MKKIIIFTIIILNFLFLGAGEYKNPMALNDEDLKGNVDSYIKWFNYYDIDGNLDKDLADTYHLYYFNDDNTLAMEKYLYGDVIGTEKKYEYYPSGELKKVTEISSGGSASEITYDYNEDRTLLVKTVDTWYGVHERYEYQLTNDGSRIDKLHLYDEDELIEIITYSYNDKNLLVEENKSSFNSEESTQTFYNYDNLGREIYMKSTQSDGVIYERSCFYKSGLLNKQISKNYYIKDGKKVFVNSYANFICNYSYEYDINDNWTTKIMTFDDGQENLTFRLMQYRDRREFPEIRVP